MNDELAAHLVRSACTDVVMRYATYVDAQAWDELFALLTDDCVWTRPASDPMVGPAQARAFFEQTRARREAANPHGALQRHNVTSVRVDPIDDANAEATWYAIVFQDDRWDGHLPAPMPMPFLMVEYRTAFRRTERGWQISRHDATHVFRRNG